MSKQLYEEAIADLKKVKEIAEDNAKRAVVEAVAPRIRELIEKELLSESFDVSEEESSGKPNDEDVDRAGKLIKQGKSPSETVEEISFNEISSESNCNHTNESVVDISEQPNNLKDVNNILRYVENVIKTLTATKGNIKESKSLSKDISQLSGALATIYSYIQEQVENPTVRLGYSLKVRKCLERLEKLQEKKMKRNLLGEEKITIELDLPGLPGSDLEDALKNASVDLVLDEDEEPSDEDEDADEEESLDLEEPSDEDADEEPSGEDEEESLDLEEPSDEEASDEEGLLEMSDNAVVEIDEGMLRREIAFMKLLRESDKDKDLELELSDSYMDDQQATDETDPIQQSLAGTSAPAGRPAPLRRRGPGFENTDDEILELDMGNESGYELDEMDVMNQADDTSDEQHSSSQPSNESVRSQMARELKLQESLRKRASELKKLYDSYKVATSRAKTLLERKDAITNSSKLKAAYAATARHYNGSVAHFNKLSESLSKGTVKNSTRSNNIAKPDASAGSNMLRKKLAETNLFNAKLLFTNKILQTELLTARQKAQVIEQLDGAETIREAKLVYESLAKALVKPRRTVSEGRVLGSSSQATRAASTQTPSLNEGLEAERWARLAGIK